MVSLACLRWISEMPNPMASVESVSLVKSCESRLEMSCLLLCCCVLRLMTAQGWTI